MAHHGDAHSALLKCMAYTLKLLYHLNQNTHSWTVATYSSISPPAPLMRWCQHCPAASSIQYPPPQLAPLGTATCTGPQADNSVHYLTIATTKTAATNWLQPALPPPTSNIFAADSVHAACSRCQSACCKNTLIQTHSETIASFPCENCNGAACCQMIQRKAS